MAEPPGEAAWRRRQGPAPLSIGTVFDADEVRDDLYLSAQARFGIALTDQALASPAFLIAKHYSGMPMPVSQPDGAVLYAPPPVAVLIRRGGGWLAARAGRGFEPVDPARGSALDAVLADPEFWRQPVHAGTQCTDAGASLLWLRLEGRPARVRRGSCGATERTERLVLQALDS